MKPTYLIPFLAIALSSQAQTTNPDENGMVEQIASETPTENTVYNTVGLQVQPEFPGGTKAFHEFILTTFKDPIIEDGPKTLKAYISFVIEKDGTVTDIKVLKDPGYGVGDEAKRVLKSSPKWKPGQQNGKPVRSRTTLPITLNIPAPEKTNPETGRQH